MHRNLFDECFILLEFVKRLGGSDKEKDRTEVDDQVIEPKLIKGAVAQKQQEEHSAYCDCYSPVKVIIMYVIDLFKIKESYCLAKAAINYREVQCFLTYSLTVIQKQNSKDKHRIKCVNDVG